MTAWTAGTRELVRQLAETARGPRRESYYAIWLVLRVAEDELEWPPLPERASRRRLAALERRLSSLTMSAPIRRAMASALPQLREGGAEAATAALQSLVAPVREALGPEAAEALQQAIHPARPQPSR
ncbi:MAG: hypothetical protein OEW17_01310 [Gemmatimonadota bacterium]|nr:hypothetical protein [Gemmatimonadota bacterium]MDH4347420.1 hypothetical protein [Gemmatimonadota bacterium]MDH5282883.1 hypothetical protein [Gemmatimonadota bacterium]